MECANLLHECIDLIWNYMQWLFECDYIQWLMQHNDSNAPICKMNLMITKY